MSQSFENWLVRPTTETSSTSSDARFSFPLLSSSTTDWLKQPISHASEINTKTPNFQEKVQTLFSEPKVQGIQNWLKTVEPYTEIDEDDFEIVEESANSMDEYSMSLDSNTDIHFIVPEPKVEITKKPDSDDMYVWLKKEQGSSLKPVPNFESIFKNADTFPYTSENIQTLFQDEHAKSAERQSKPVRSSNKEIPASTEHESDMTIWIVGQNKDVEKTTITECRLFQTLRHESENLLQWIKKETPRNQEYPAPVSSPEHIWISLQNDSTEWLKKSSSPLSDVATSTQSNPTLQEWLKTDKEKGSLFKESSSSGFLFNSDNYDQAKWLMSDKENTSITPTTNTDNSLVNWNDILSRKRDDFSTDCAKSTFDEEKPKPRSLSKNNPNEQWLISNVESPVPIQLKLFGDVIQAAEITEQEDQKENVDSSGKYEKKDNASLNQWLLYTQ